MAAPGNQPTILQASAEETLLPVCPEALLCPSLSNSSAPFCPSPKCVAPISIALHFAQVNEQRVTIKGRGSGHVARIWYKNTPNSDNRDNPDNLRPFQVAAPRESLSLSLARSLARLLFLSLFLYSLSSLSDGR